MSLKQEKSTTTSSLGGEIYSNTISEDHDETFNLENLSIKEDDTTNEIWKTAVYGDLLLDKYEVSNKGNVRNSTKKAIKQHVRGGGNVIIINYNAKSKTVRVGKLVLCTFAGYEAGKKVVHINGNNIDDRLTNLKWSTDSEIIKKNWKNKDRARRSDSHKIIRKNVVTKETKIYDSVIEAARELGKTRSEVVSIRNRIAGAIGKQQNAYGYSWSYYDKPEEEKLKEGEGKSYPKNPDYLITKDGRVYSIKSKRFLIPKLGITFNYLTITISNNRKTTVIPVHRLVAETYLEPSLNEKAIYVNHKDGNKLNNILNNLEWVTHEENCRHAHDTGLSSVRKKVIQFNLEGKIINKFNSITEAFEKTGVNDSTISAVCMNKPKRKTAGGFVWKYEKDLSQEQLNEVKKL